MQMNNLTKIYFSPTKTTAKIVETIAGSIQCAKQASLNITQKRIRENQPADIQSNLVIIGAPVYCGRIPAEVSGFMSKTHGNGTYAVLVVVYGNREYEDALRELYDAACAAGFIPIAGAAFIGEHSYSSEKLPMAHGRPDENDLKAAKRFGTLIQKKVDRLVEDANPVQLFIPGGDDYRNKKIQDIPLVPKTSKKLCTRCKHCIDTCPVDAISLHSSLITNAKDCILCFACIKSCPTQARRLNDLLWTWGMKKLYKKCLVRKEPEYYFAGEPIDD